MLQVVTALDRNNVSDITQDKKACKSLIVNLIDKLEPEELQERIREARYCWSSEQRAALSYFQQRVSLIAVEVNKGILSRTRIQERRSRKRNRSFSADKNTGGDHKKPLLNGSNKKKQGKHQKDSDWSAPCLNVEHCECIHRVKNCPVTSYSKKKELSDKYLQEKMKNNTAQFKAKMMATNKGTESIDHKEDRYEIFLESQVRAVGLGYSGSRERYRFKRAR